MQVDIRSKFKFKKWREVVAADPVENKRDRKHGHSFCNSPSPRASDAAQEAHSHDNNSATATNRRKSYTEPTWSQSDSAKWATVHFKRTKSPISRVTVNRALKLAKATASVAGVHALRTKITPAAFSRLEEELVRWIDRANEREISVSQLMVREQAREIANDLEIPVGDFELSNHWLWAFKKRYNIQVLRDHGEAGSCDSNDVSRGRLECQDTIM